MPVGILTGLKTGIRPGLKPNIAGSTYIPLLVSIAVTPANPSVAHTQTQQFVATGRYDNNTFVVITSLCTWTSGTPANATITSPAALATTLQIGTSVITATLGTKSGSTTLTAT